MSSNVDFTTIFSAAMTGGLVVGAAQFIGARAKLRKAKSEGLTSAATLPGKVDSIAVAGASEAVLTMDKALTAANRQIDWLAEQLEANAAHYKAEIKSLREQVAELKLQLHGA